VQAADVSPLRLSLIVDNVRTPDNLGAVIRVAAAAGARQVLLTKGCVEAWSPKVVRAAAGAHFQVHQVFFFSIM
jgi:tRNA G18 (ribose-2'-O)-methylase SpoU